MSRVEWRSQRAACFTTIHAVVDGDLMTVCGKPAFQAVPTRPARSQGQVCPDCVEIGRELARHIAELDTEGQEDAARRLGYTLLYGKPEGPKDAWIVGTRVYETAEAAALDNAHRNSEAAPARVVEVVLKVADRG